MLMSASEALAPAASQDMSQAKFSFNPAPVCQNPRQQALVSGYRVEEKMSQPAQLRSHPRSAPEGPASYCAEPRDLGAANEALDSRQSRRAQALGAALSRYSPTSSPALSRHTNPGITSSGQAGPSSSRPHPDLHQAPQQASHGYRGQQTWPMDAPDLRPRPPQWTGAAAPHSSSALEHPALQQWQQQTTGHPSRLDPRAEPYAHPYSYPQLPSHLARQYSADSLPLSRPYPDNLQPPWHNQHAASQHGQQQQHRATFSYPQEHQLPQAYPDRLYRQPPGQHPPSQPPLTSSSGPPLPPHTQPQQLHPPHHRQQHQQQQHHQAAQGLPLPPPQHHQHPQGQQGAEARAQPPPPLSMHDEAMQHIAAQCGDEARARAALRATAQHPRSFERWVDAALDWLVEQQAEASGATAEQDAQLLAQQQAEKDNLEAAMEASLAEAEAEKRKLAEQLAERPRHCWPRQELLERYKRSQLLQQVPPEQAEALWGEASILEQWVDLLELECSCQRWYPQPAVAVFNEVAQKLLAALQSGLLLCAQQDAPGPQPESAPGRPAASQQLPTASDPQPAEAALAPQPAAAVAGAQAEAGGSPALPEHAACQPHFKQAASGSHGEKAACQSQPGSGAPQAGSVQAGSDTRLHRASGAALAPAEGSGSGQEGGSTGSDKAQAREDGSTGRSPSGAKHDRAASSAGNAETGLRRSKRIRLKAQATGSDASGRAGEAAGQGDSQTTAATSALPSSKAAGVAVSKQPSSGQQQGQEAAPAEDAPEGCAPPQGPADQHEQELPAEASQQPAHAGAQPAAPTPQPGKASSEEARSEGPAAEEQEPDSSGQQQEQVEQMGPSRPAATVQELLMAERQRIEDAAYAMPDVPGAMPPLFAAHLQEVADDDDCMIVT